MTHNSLQPTTSARRQYSLMAYSGKHMTSTKAVLLSLKYFPNHSSQDSGSYLEVHRVPPRPLQYNLVHRPTAFRSTPPHGSPSGPSARPLATNLLSVRNTQVYLMALTALMEPCILWHWIKHNSSCWIPSLRWLSYHPLYSSDMSHWILLQGRSASHLSASFTLLPGCGIIYAWSEQHTCCSLCRGSSHRVGVSSMPSAVYAFLQLSAMFYLSTIAINLMVHSAIYV
jgi:hypothetical protein